MFGGLQPEHGIVDDVYIIDFSSMVWWPWECTCNNVHTVCIAWDRTYSFQSVMVWNGFFCWSNYCSKKNLYTRTIISFIDSCKSDYTPAMLDNIFLSPQNVLLKRICPNNKIYAPVSCTLSSGGLKYPYVILVCMCWPNMYYFLFHCSMHCKKI